MGYFDAHCHLAKSSDADALIARARGVGIDGWAMGGIDRADWEKQRALRDRHPDALVTSFGIHPWTVAAATDEDWRTLERMAPDADAIGETGLDLGPRHAETMELQREAFRRQLALAARLDKPLILHVVRAHSEALAMLPSGRGIVHSFGGPREIADEYVRKGYLISIGPSVLREGSKNFKKAVMSLPLQSLALETDAPDQTPESADLIRIADAVARLRGDTREAILAAGAGNIRKLFGK